MIMFIRNRNRNRTNPTNTKLFWFEETLEIIKVFLLVGSPKSIFHIPFNFPWGNEYYLQYFATILKVFSPVQSLPPLSPHSQVDAALSFASEVWWRRKWVQPRGLIQNPGQLSKVWLRVTLKLKWPWNLIEGISASEIFCNTHGTISCKDFGMPKNHNTHPSLLKVFICNTVMTGQGIL